MRSVLGKHADTLYGLMRIVVGLLFAAHGAQKLFGWFGGDGWSVLWPVGVAGIVEFFGGLAIALGVVTSWAAFISAVQMLVAYLWMHTNWLTHPNGFWPIQNRGELALIYCLVFLYIASRGTVKLGLRRGD